jgi:hypothetical protein
MTVDDLLASVGAPAPPEGVSDRVRALWLDARGDWDGAHAAVGDDASAEGAWVHAYLHRKEGDTSNAAYWYRRAGRTPEAGDHQGEWRRIAGELLARESAARQPLGTRKGDPR